MEHFGGLTKAQFKTDERGRDLFYPWGVFGKGFVLDSPRKKEEIRQFIKFHTIASLSLFLFTAFTFNGFYAFGLLPVLYFWYWYRMNRLLDSLETTSEKGGIREGYRVSAQSYDVGVLWFYEVSFVLLVMAGFYIFL